MVSSDVSTTGAVLVGSNVETIESRSKPCIVPLPVESKSMDTPTEASCSVWARRIVLASKRIA